MRNKLLASKVPLFIVVKNILIEEIESGKLGSDGMLPSEEILAKRYKVSRSTIRSTLQSMEKDGIVTRQHGIGTFLNSESLQVKLHIDEAKGFFQLIRDSGHTPSIYETKISTIVIDGRLSKLLGVPKNKEALLLERLFLGDGKPGILVLEYIPNTSLIQIPSVEEIPESIYEFAEIFCHEAIDYSISEIIPIKANSLLQEKMGLKQEEMFLRLEEIHYGKQNRSLIYSDVYVRDSMIRFQVLRRRQHY